MPPALAWLRQMISGDVWSEKGAAKTFVTIADQLLAGGDPDAASAVARADRASLLVDAVPRPDAAVRRRRRRRHRLSGRRPATAGGHRARGSGGDGPIGAEPGGTPPAPGDRRSGRGDVRGHRRRESGRLRRQARASWRARSSGCASRAGSACSRRRSSTTRGLPPTPATGKRPSGRPPTPRPWHATLASRSTDSPHSSWAHSPSRTAAATPTSMLLLAGPERTLTAINGGPLLAPAHLARGAAALERGTARRRIPRALAGVQRERPGVSPLHALAGRARPRRGRRPRSARRTRHDRSRASSRRSQVAASPRSCAPVWPARDRC